MSIKRDKTALNVYFEKTIIFVQYLQIFPLIVDHIWSMYSSNCESS